MCAESSRNNHALTADESVISTKNLFLTKGVSKNKWCNKNVTIAIKIPCFSLGNISRSYSPTCATFPTVSLI
jgi:hypothetical protein